MENKKQNGQTCKSWIRRHLPQFWRRDQEGCTIQARVPRKCPENEAKYKCRPHAHAAAQASQSAITQLEKVAALAVAAADHVLVLAEAPRRGGKLDADVCTRYSDDNINMALCVLRAARAAQAATVCAHLAIDIGNGILDEATGSLLLGRPTSAKETTAVTTMAVERATEVTPQRIQATLDSLATAQAAIKSEHPVIYAGMLDKSSAKMLRYLAQLEDKLKCAKDNAETLHDTISSSRWWHGPGSSISSAMAVADVAKVMDAGSDCFNYARWAVIEADTMRVDVAKGIVELRGETGQTMQAVVERVDMTDVGGFGLVLDRLRMQVAATMALAATMPTYV